ncbi:MAG: hypothetical protein NC341_06495 [Blautia sp.]|nr:hypothetical protein [Blautia sp.]MCM1200985.1 hypothetical protein [Bacteroides fragilis]
MVRFAFFQVYFDGAALYGMPSTGNASSIEAAVTGEKKTAATTNRDG